jgi:general secretion pathway protein F
MPAFAYTARDPGGQALQGTVDAPSRREALRVLSARGLRPLAVEESNSRGPAAVPAPSARARGPARWTRRERLPFLKALSRLVSGGLSAGEAVRLLALRLQEPPLKSLATTLWEQLSQGRTLSQAFADIPQVFDGQTISLVAAGEATGSLREVLPRLIQRFTEQRELQRRLVNALSYPIFVCISAIMLVLLFLFFILPKIQALLHSLGGRLPPATQILVSISNFLLQYGPFLAGALVLVAIAWWRGRHTEAGRRATDQAVLRLPFAGSYAVRLNILNFTHTVAILLENGITTAESLRMAERTVTNLILRDRLHAAIDRVLEGESLSGALGRTELFPLLLLDQLAVGEQSGSVAASLRAIAKDCQEDLNNWLTAFTRVLSSVVLGGTFGFVAFLAYAILTAVLQVSSSFKF